MKQDQPWGLRCEHLQNPVGIDIMRPVLSWIYTAAPQRSYELEIRDEHGAAVLSTGRVESEEALFAADVPYESRGRYIWRVRCFSEDGAGSDWSEEAFFEYGLLESSDWKARWIEPELSVDPKVRQPASYLKKCFMLSEEAIGRKARLYITAHGIYTARLNGRPVTEDVLCPGRDDYDYRLQYQTYDVSALLVPGENLLEVTVGDGWWRGCSSIDGVRNLFGDRLALLAQLEFDGKCVCATDETFMASQDGPLRFTDTEQGEVYDARLEDMAGALWHGVTVNEKNAFALPVCSNSVPIREHEAFPGRLFQTPSGKWVVDFGQNMAGYTEFTLEAEEGQRLILWHGETLDENGEFTQKNFDPGARHKNGGITQKVEYICQKGHNSYKTAFALFGFRYALVETDIDLRMAGFRTIAHAVYSDMETTAGFTCDDPDLNRLFENALWSMKSNFADIPTDCPTRERSGWNGDAGVFAHTGTRLMDAGPVYRKWLRNCVFGQHKNGLIENICPKDNKRDGISHFMSGAAGWADGCVIVPYELYKMTGDARILAETYPMLRAWQEYAIRRARRFRPANLLKKNPYRRYTVDAGFHWGEWCEPDVTGAQSIRENLRHGAVPLATAYFAYTSRLMSEIAAVIGRGEDAERYGEIAEQATLAYRFAAMPEGHIESARQCDYVRPLAFGLLEKPEAEETARRLNELVTANGYHLNTGFLSTPFLCEVLARYGYRETAYRLLLQEENPGWLYAVRHGATTIWERWDGVREDGTVHDSLNHYSYGAIASWLLEGVGGIRYEKGRVQFEPIPDPALGAAKASLMTPKGPVGCEWTYTDIARTKGKVTITVPMSFTEGKDYTVILPEGFEIKENKGDCYEETT